MKKAIQNPIRSALQWVGSKWRLMPNLLPHIPDHHRYVSVFGGSAADILRKPQSKEEVYNDLDSNVVNYFKVLQNEKTRKNLIIKILLTPYSRSQFQKCAELLASAEDNTILRAWAFSVCNMFGYVGRGTAQIDGSAFAINLKLTQSPRWREVTGQLTAVAHRLRDVLIECRPWAKIIERYDDKNTLFYCDPPYVLGTRVGKKLYRHEMMDDEHRDLVTRLCDVKGKVMLSGYSNAIYDQHLAEWRRIEFKTRCSIGCGKGKADRTEVVWLNFNKNGLRIG